MLGARPSHDGTQFPCTTGSLSVPSAEWGWWHLPLGLLPRLGSPVPAATKPDALQRASVGIIDQKACSALYNFSLTDRMLCAGFLEGQVDSCQVARRGPRGPGGLQTQRPHPSPGRGEGRQGLAVQRSPQSRGNSETNPVSRNA